MKRKAPAWRLAQKLVVVPVLRVALPTACAGCGTALGAWQRAGVCLACWTDLRVVPSPLCSTCATPLPIGTDLLGRGSVRCGACAVAPPAQDSALAAVLYEGTARRLLLAAKSGNRPELLREFGRQLATVVGAVGLARGCAAIVPVPSHPWRFLRRGFDPALEIARALARGLDLPVDPRRIRRRMRFVRPVKALSSKRRRDEVRAAFRARRRRDDGPVLLVDDVLTTGASASACAKALKDSGCPEVRLAVWARTPRIRSAF